MLTSPRVYRFNTDEFLAMDAAGVLPPDGRFELIDGEIIEMPPIGPEHADLVDIVTARLARLFGDQVRVGSQRPVQLGPSSLPQPDVVLLRPHPEGYRTRHPGPDDILLVVEVSDTTARYDREVKASLYARAGVPELWLMDARTGRTTVMRDPDGETYRTVVVREPGETVDFAALPGWSFTLPGRGGPLPG